MKRRKDKTVACKYCNLDFRVGNIHRHESKCSNNPQFGTPCPKCGILKHPNNITCSTACYNSLFRSKENNPNFKTGKKNYRTTCFMHHKKECCVCGWDLIVEVHHFDGNKENNSPKNLIPLCPNHHAIWHSKHRDIIRDVVERYHAKFGT